MKISAIKLLIIELVLALFLFLNIFVINIKNGYIISMILLLFLGVTIVALGYEKNRQRFKKDIILNIIIYTFLFQIILYLIGLFLGFIRNPYSLSFLNIIKNIFPILLIIVISEFLRYCINIKGQNKKYLLIISILIFVLIDVSLQIHLYDLQNKKEVFELVSYIILPSISKNFLLTYFSIKFGYAAGILYRLIMELPTYFMPIFPDINAYLNAVFNFLFPLFLFYINYWNFEPKEDLVNIRKKNVIYKVSGVIAVCFLTIVIILTSGIFSIYALVIGSGSMTPTINKGDVAIIKKLSSDELKELKEKDILVFQYDKKVVVHRIVEIHEVNGNFTYRTKGDNNETEDGWIIDEKKVIGKVISRVPLVGYPTVWLNEMMN